jgi:prepilin signal peptidase PulO-like enzyme (type II secretory pathway)
MSVVFLVIGLVCGWLLTLAADVLPQWAGTPPASRHAGWRAPALWRWRRDRTAAPEALVELATGLAFACAVMLAGMPTAVLVSSVCAFLILTALVDLKYRLILNVTTYPAFAVLALLHLMSGQAALISALLGAGFAFFIFYMTARLKPGQLGMGDVKFATLIGFGFGFPGVLVALLIGAGAGALTAVWLLSHKSKASRTIPYAPFLCLGAVAVLFIPILTR